MKLPHILSVFLLTALWSCGSSGGKDNPPAPVPQINVELPSSGVVEIDGTGSGTVKFTTDSKWSISVTDTKASEWLTVSPMNGDPGAVQLALTGKPNTDAQSRKSSVTITAGTTVQKFEVSQPAAKGSISIDKDSFTAEAQQTSIEVNVTTNNAEWQASTVADWMTVAPKNGKGSTKVAVSLTENKDQKARSTEVVFSVGEEKQILTITQMGSEPPVLEIDKTSADVAAEAGDFAVNIVTNGAQWKIESASDWLSALPKQGIDNTSVKVAYTENPTMQPRTGTVKFVSGKLSQTLTVVQKEGSIDLVLNPSSKNVEAEANSFTVDVSTKGTDWQATGCPDWVTLDYLSFPHSKTITVSCAANAVSKERSCAITFKTGQVIKTLTITQAAASATLSLDVVSKNVWNKAGSFDVNLKTNEAEWVSSHPYKWVTVSPDKGTGNTRIKISFEANNDDNERKETVTFKAGQETKTVTITQAPADVLQTYIELDITSKDVAYTKGSFDVSLTTNATQWVAEHIPDWIKVSPTTDNTGRKVLINYDENDRDIPRFATIKFNAGNVAAYLTVTQAAKETPANDIKGAWEGLMTFWDGSANIKTDIKDKNATALTITADGESATLNGTWSQNGNQVILSYSNGYGSCKLTGTVDANYQNISGKAVLSSDGESESGTFTLSRAKNGSAVISINADSKVLKQLFNK